MAQTVRDVMTQNPRAVEPGTTVAEAARLMKSEDVGSLPIVESGRLAGMVTDRDIAIRVVAEGKDTQTTMLGEIASKHIFSIEPEQKLGEAMEMMARHKVRRLPVVDEDGRLVGIVAQADVAREGSDKRTGELVEEISR